VWQPNRPQWWIISAIAALVVLGWSPDRENGPSLGMKALHWAVDPWNRLAALPPPLPLGLDDNGDAVAAHDALEAEYYRQYSSSSTARARLTLKNARDPLDPITQRQVLIGVAVFGVLLVWRLDTIERRAR